MESEPVRKFFLTHYNLRSTGVYFFQHLPPFGPLSVPDAPFAPVFVMVIVVHFRLSAANWDEVATGAAVRMKLLAMPAAPGVTTML